MADWQQYMQSVFFGLVFSFLLAKLFSVIFSFRDENLRISHADTPNAQAELTRQIEEKESLIVDKEDAPPNEYSSVAATVGSNHSDVSDDDDWEGVESTELDEAFSAATAFVAATAVDRASEKVSNEVQLQLYGLYKIATEGPCTAPAPSALKFTARAKWLAWQKLGAMPPEEAMEKYVDIVSELFPSWATGSDTKAKGEESKEVSNNNSKGPMGPVFSSFNFEEEPGRQLQLDAIHAFAREGDEQNLLDRIKGGVSVNLKDSEGRTPLHWAVDRGHLKTVELLLNQRADVNMKDNEGQTPLHYAAVCERSEIAEFLVKQKADMEIKDNDGNLPSDLCELSWPWMQRGTHD